MPVCPECGKYVEKDAIVCKSCGTTLRYDEKDVKEVLYYYGRIHKPITEKEENEMKKKTKIATSEK